MSEARQGRRRGRPRRNDDQAVAVSWVLQNPRVPIEAAREHLDGRNRADGIDREQMRDFIARLADCKTARKEIKGTEDDIYSEAKEAGIPRKDLNQVFRESLLEPDVRLARYERLDEYRAALGLFTDTPLGAAALAAAEHA